MELDKSDSVDSAIGIVEKQKLMLILKQIPDVTGATIFTLREVEFTAVDGINVYL